MMTKVSMIVAAALLALTATSAGLAHNAVNPGVTILAQRATALLHSQGAFAKAVLLEAEGSPAKPGHPVKTADRIVTWRFVFDNRQTGNKFQSVYITAHDHLLGKPRGSIRPFLQDQPIRPIPKMTFTQAVHLLNAANYTQGFYAVTLRKPKYLGITDTEYIFAMVRGKIIAVNTRTGEVKKIS